MKEDSEVPRPSWLELIHFELVETPAEYYEKAKPTRPPPLQCHCGRFAKHLQTRRHYNGTWDLITIHLQCSRCGEVTIECV